MDNAKRSTLWSILVILGCIGFYAIPIGVIGNTAGIFVAPVMDEYGWTQTDTTMYRTIQPLVSAITCPIAGKLLQKYNPRIILTIVTICFGLGSVWSAYASTLLEWNIYGVIYGITAGFYMYLAAPVLINNWFKKNNGTALAVTAASLSLIGAIASPVGQSLINQYGWHTARMMMSVFTTVLGGLLCFAFVRKDPASMGLEAFGANEVMNEQGTFDPPVEHGATVKQALRSPGLYMLLLVAGIFVTCAAFFQQIPAFCARGELGANVGAMAVSIMMVGGIIAKLVLGVLNDTIGVKYTGVIAAAGGAIGITLAFMAGSNVLMFYAGMVVFGFGYAALTVIAPLLARDSFGSKNYSQIYSYVSTAIYIFTAICFVLFGMFYDTTGSYDLCFILVIALYIIAMILVPLTSKISQKSWKTS